MNLLTYTPSEILDLFKTAFYNDHGTPMIIGSDDFTASATFTYVLSVLVNAINNSAGQRFIETATGTYLDATATTMGLSRPSAASSSAVFRLDPSSTGSIPANGLEVSDGAHVFTNNQILTVTAGTPVDVMLYAVNAGASYNGISIGAISTLVAGNHIASAYNTTITGGGSDGYPYTEAGDNAFREYLLARRGAFVVGGSAPAYKSKCYELNDNRLLDVKVLQDGEAGYVRGKVRIYTLWDMATLNAVGVRLLNNKLLALCTAEDFRPIGDYVEIAPATRTTLDIGNRWRVKYRLRDKESAFDHLQNTLTQYRDYLLGGFGRAFSEGELNRRFVTPAENGVSALGFDLTDTTNRYSIPTTGAVWSLSWPLISSIEGYISAGMVELIDTEG